MLSIYRYINLQWNESRGWFLAQSGGHCAVLLYVAHREFLLAYIWAISTMLLYVANSLSCLGDMGCKYSSNSNTRCSHSSEKRTLKKCPRHPVCYHEAFSISQRLFFFFFFFFACMRSSIISSLALIICFKARGTYEVSCRNNAALVGPYVHAAAPSEGGGQVVGSPREEYADFYASPREPL